MEVSPLKYTRAYFGEAAQGMSDAAIMAQYIQQNKVDPSTDMQAVIEQMEAVGKQKITETQANSTLKATRRLLGDQTLGLSDERLIREYATQMQLPEDTPLSSIVKTMEGSARRGLFEQDRRRDEDQVNSVFALPQSVKDAKDSLGIKGQSLFTAQDIGNAINIHAVYNFLKPKDARDGFVETVAKEASVLGLPFFARQGKRVGQWLARQGADDPERMKDLDRIENLLNDPDAIARYVAEVNRYKESPELFTEDEVENLRQATLAYETTSAFFEVEPSATRDAVTGAIESFAFPVVKAAANLAGSAANAFGFDREFTDDALRQLNFTDQVLSDQDEESKSAILGSILGSAAQTVLAVTAGVGAPGLFAIYGAQGASGNIEEYRQFVRSKGLDPSVGEEAFVALGGMAISGGLAAALTGQTLGRVPGIKKWTKGAEAELFRKAVEGGGLSTVAQNLSRQTLFGKGVEIARNVLSNPELIKASAKSYAKFAASTAPVEGFEEISEAVLNEGLMNLAVENYETDPDEFMREIILSGVGGLVGGAAVGPAARRRYSREVENTSRNVLGLEHLAAASPQEAARNLESLNNRAFQIQELYGRIPAPIMQEYASMRDRLQGVANGEIKVSEAFTNEELANGGSGVLSVGEILSKADLRNTAIYEAADQIKGERSAGVSQNQRDAHRSLVQYFENSDLAEENPELVQQILNRIYLTPLSTGTGKRVAATTTAMGTTENGELIREFMGVYLTNGTDETAIHDEIFHIINDGKTDFEQQAIVDAYNQIYKTNYTSYSDPKTRDKIAKTAASIITGKTKAKSEDLDNEFVRIVEAQRNGLVSEANPNLKVYNPVAEKKNVLNPDGNGIPVTGDEIMRALRRGEMRRVAYTHTDGRKGLKGRLVFQDNDGTVFTYDSVIDSEGNERGVLTPIEVREIMPTTGPNMVTALQTFPKDLVKREAGPIARRPVEDVEFEVVLEPDPNAFYVDSNGNVIEFKNGVPVKAFEVVMATDANGNTFEVMRPVDVDLNEVKRLYDAGQLLLEGKEPGPSRPADFIGSLLVAGKIVPPPSSPIFNISDYLKAKEDQLPPKVREELQKMADKQQEQQETAAQLDAETGAVKYAETEPTVEADRPTAATPRLSDIVTIIPDNVSKPVVEALMSGEVLAIEGLKSVGNETDPVTGFRLIEVTNDKLLSDLLDAGLVVPGRVLIAEDIVDTVDNIVSFNPDALNQEMVSSLENEITATPEADQVFFELAMPTKGPGSRGGKIKFIYLVDEAGNKEAFQSKTSAINTLATRTESEVVSEPGRGSSDKIYAGTSVYTTESGSANVRELVQAELGDSVNTIGTLLFTTEAGSPEYERLRKAAKKFVKQIINKAIGNSRYTPETFDAARRELLDAMIDVQDAPASEVTSEIDPPTEVEQEIGEPTVDTADSSIRRIIRDMRRAVKRGALSRTSGGTLEFNTKQKKSAKIFADKVAKLGADDATTRMEEVDGKTQFFVTATVHPDIATDVFNNSDEVAQRAENPIEVTAPSPNVEFNAPGRTRKTRQRKSGPIPTPTLDLTRATEELNESLGRIRQLTNKLFGTKIEEEPEPEQRDPAAGGFYFPEKSYPPLPPRGIHLPEEEAEVATPEQVAEKKKKKRIRKKKAEAVNIQNAAVEEHGTPAEKARVARKKAGQKPAKPKRVTIATFQNFLDQYGEIYFTNEDTSTIDIKKDMTKSGPVTISRYKIDGEVVATHTVYDDTGAERFHISPDYLNDDTTNDNISLHMTMDEATSASVAWKAKYGYARPVIVSETSKEITALLEDFVETFQIGIPIYYVDLSRFEGLENEIDLATEIRKSGNIPNRIAANIIQNIYDFESRPTSRGAYVAGEDYGIVYLNPRNIVKQNQGAPVEVIKAVAYNTIVHELGHSLMYIKGGESQNNETLRAAHEESMRAGMTIGEYLANYLVPDEARTIRNIFQPLLARHTGEHMDTIRASFDRLPLEILKILSPKFYQYMTSYDEWFARQFQIWTASGETSSEKLGSVFQNIKNALKKFYDKYLRAGNISSSQAFDDWMNNLIETSKAEPPTDIYNMSGFAGTPMEEDAMAMTLVDYHMMPPEMQARTDNEFELAIRNQIYDLRGKLSDSVWQGIEKKVRAGEEVTGTPDEVRYAEFFKSAMDMAANRRLVDSDDIPMDVMVSYASAASLFPAALSERMDQVYSKFRNSFLNDARRRIFSPSIVRARIIADDHPDIPQLREIVARTSSIPGEESNTIPYTDAILREITLRTSSMSKVLDPIFRHYGYKGTTAQRVVAAVGKRKNLATMMDIVFRGVRNKNAPGVDLDAEFDGVRLEEIIDAVRAEMDKLGEYASQEIIPGDPDSAIIDPEDFITYDDEGQHYVPRVYNKETIIDNIEYFRDFVVRRNLERVYRQDMYLAQQQEALGRKLTIAEEEEFKNSVPKDLKLSENDVANINAISEAITNNIVYGRSFNIASVFNPDYQPGKNFAKVIEQFGEDVPDRLKQRKLWFIPDNELFGEVEIEGKKINFMDTNIISVMSNAISGIVKRVEFAKAYGKRGELFAEAEEALRQKVARTTGDARQVNKIRRDIDALRGLFESVAEIVDASKVGTRRFLNEAPIRNTARIFSKFTTIAVMGLSSFLAVVETGNMFIRTGFKGGMIGMAKFAEIAARKTFRWPAAITGFAENYSDIMEMELVALGYLHEIGEDITSRSRFDPFFNEGDDPAEAGVATSKEGFIPRLAAATDFGEDAFYRLTMLEQITRISQVAAAHASNVLIRGLRDAFYSPNGFNKAQIRELKRLGFTKGGEVDMQQVQEYVEFFDALEESRANGMEASEEFARLNERMYKDVHYRVMSRLITQQITRPNVASRTVWSNSHNPLVRVASRLRSFTWGYRSHIATFFSDEARGLYEDKDLAGLASFFSRFMPILMLAFMTIIAREELKADVHEMVGNTSQAETIRTRLSNRTAAEMILDTVDKTGLTLQSSDLINAVEGAQYGAGLFATVYGVSASRAEKMYEAAMRSAYTGDPAFLVNGTTSSLFPAANTGIWDFARLEIQSSDAQRKADADFYGMIGW